MGTRSCDARAFVNAEAADLVRSGRAFEAGKLAYLVVSSAADGGLTTGDEWDAFIRWADQFKGLVPNALRVAEDWNDKSFEAVPVALANAWMAFRGGWLVAETNTNGSAA